MYIIEVASECAPVSKVGGLADVIGGLSAELSLRGNAVEIILPFYDCMRYDQIFNLTVSYNYLPVPWYDGVIPCVVWFGLVHGKRCFFIDPQSKDNFFRRNTFYGCDDDTMRFAFFSKAVLEFMLQTNRRPDCIHCHDWQTGLLPVLLFEIYKFHGMENQRVCYTIHNFKHQGQCGNEILAATGLNRPEYYFDYQQLRDNHDPFALNCLKAGIVYSNFVNTVSTHHAWESRYTDYGFGLVHTLNMHQQKIGGILNGIDYNTWNPEIDHFIPYQYTFASIENKYRNKEELRKRFWLYHDARPIISYVGRLDNQKGIDLICHTANYAVNNGAQFVLLGTGSDHSIYERFLSLKNQLNDNVHCHIELGFDEDLSHLIYAGSDMVIVPSAFEPCGLSQMIAMKYGTIPVVRSTGGLVNSVFDRDYSELPWYDRNGYTFTHMDNYGIESALKRAVGLYYDYPGHFRSLIENAMSYDFSWNIPGKHYENVFDFIRHK